MTSQKKVVENGKPVVGPNAIISNNPEYSDLNGSSNNSTSSTLFAPQTSLFVKNLRSDITLAEFTNAFSAFNPLKIQLTTSSESDKFGFLEFKTLEQSKFCFNSMNLRLVVGQKIEIFVLEQRHKKYFDMESVVDDINDSKNKRYTSPLRGRSGNWNKTRKDYRGHSPKNTYRGQSDTFRGRDRSRSRVRSRSRSRSNSPRRYKRRSRSRSNSLRRFKRQLSPRSPPKMQQSPSRRAVSPPGYRTNLRNQNGRSKSPSSGSRDQKKQRTLSPDVQVIERNDGSPINPRKVDYGGRGTYQGSSVHRQDTRNDSRDRSARDDIRGSTPKDSRPLGGDRASKFTDPKKLDEIKELTDYLHFAGNGHSRQDSDSLTLPPSYNESSRQPFSHDIEDAFNPVTSLTHTGKSSAINPPRPSRTKLDDPFFSPPMKTTVTLKKPDNGN